MPRTMQRDAFHRLRGLFDGIGIVGGLLAVIGADSLHELPDDNVRAVPCL